MFSHMYLVKSVKIKEISAEADYYITVNIENIYHPFGIKVQIRGGESEEAGGIYTTAAEAKAEAERFAEHEVLPGNLRDIIRDGLIELVC